MCRLSRKNRPPHCWKVLFTGEWRECCWSEPESISGLQTWRWQVGYCGANSNSQFFLEILTIQWHPDPSHVPVLSKSFSHNGQTGMQFPHNVYKCLSNINDEAWNIFCVQHNGIKRVFIYYYYFFSDKSSSNLLYILPCMLPNKVARVYKLGLVFLVSCNNTIVCTSVYGTFIFMCNNHLVQCLRNVSMQSLRKKVSFSISHIPFPIIIHSPFAGSSLLSHFSSYFLAHSKQYFKKVLVLIVTFSWYIT